MVLVSVSAQAVLGLYSLGYAVARAPGDAALSGANSLLRARLAHTENEVGRLGDVLHDHIVAVLRVLLLALLGLAVGLLGLGIKGVATSWSSVTILAAIMGGSMLASAFAWSNAVLLNHRQQSARVYPVQLLEIVASLGIGWLLTIDTTLGAIAFFVREVVDAIGMGYANKEVLQQRTWKLLVALTITGLVYSTLLSLALKLLSQ
jgi:drug/metabolite transporter (DMT)-like permease